MRFALGVAYWKLAWQITIFDNRGCTQHKNKEYAGPKTGGEDDEMVVKVSNEKIPYPTNDVVEEVQLANRRWVYPFRLSQISF